ncbi:TPA: hypothetical protein TXJ06_002194 [Streptococcus suis]|uniref:Uncharacterized protein n=1 Tax=Streptococcus suis TaxID=1307 RepID=A0AAJ2PJ33_STRSU|nr:hypothetical protein [Streptococcus suis]MBS8100641.1 hypothetical protein [Streptococcus suis]MDW8645833.1 hypothetical protein [Streptococcus suis]NQR49573.1 hypothetical protein [Streptococcus suis]HEL1585394.1 hypothetical protein [Streptococcus suis]HEL1749294.1 hypothetical protein [Streptococcus suis]
MANEQLKELALSLLAIKESLELHKVGADALYSMRGLDAEFFQYHASQFLGAIFETLNNEINSIDEIAEKMLDATN